MVGPGFSLIARRYEDPVARVNFYLRHDHVEAGLVRAEAVTLRSSASAPATTLEPAFCLYLAMSVNFFSNSSRRRSPRR